MRCGAGDAEEGSARHQAAAHGVVETAATPSLEDGEIDGTLIASGEHEYTQHGFRMLFHHHAVEVVQPDVSWCGGLTAARRIAAMTAERGLLLVPHRGGSLYGLPLVLAFANAPLAESFGTGAPGTDLMHAMTARFEGGAYWPSEAPGFGAELTEALVRAHAHRS